LQLKRRTLGGKREEEPKMRGIRWPLLGATLLPIVTVVILGIRDATALKAVAASDWLLLSGLGALAGVAFYLKARIFGDGDLPTAHVSRSLERQSLDGSEAAGATMLQIERTHSARLRSNAETDRLAARRYRLYLEGELHAIDYVLADPERDGVDAEALLAERASLAQDLLWAREREGLLGRLLA
jgi:hypothetical protein